MARLPSPAKIAPCCGVVRRFRRLVRGYLHARQLTIERMAMSIPNGAAERGTTPAVEESAAAAVGKMSASIEN